MLESNLHSDLKFHTIYSYLHAIRKFVFLPHSMLYFMCCFKSVV